MTVAQHDLLYQAALDWVNKVRADYGYKALERLPKGVRKSPTECVVIRALDPVNDRSTSHEFGERYKYGPDYGGMVHLARKGKMVAIKMPEIVARFAVAFDEGRYPALTDAW